MSELLAINNQYVKDFITAYKFNKRNGGGKNLIKAVESFDYHVFVMQIDGVENIFSHDRDITVSWNSREGIRFGNDKSQSAATILEHEMDHAVSWTDNSMEHRQRESMSDDQYDDKEERRVITGSETFTAKKNGESVRHNHRGKRYKTKSPISTEGLYW